MPTPYETLGLTQEATDSEIKNKYRELAFKYHPDKYSAKPEIERLAAEQKMAEINAAHDIIGDKVKREQYDSKEKVSEYVKKALHVQFFKPYHTPFEPLKSVTFGLAFTALAILAGTVVLIAGAIISLHFAFKALTLSSDLLEQDYAKLKAVHISACAMVVCVSAIMATILPCVYMASLLTCSAATVVSPFLKGSDSVEEPGEAPSAPLLIAS